MRDIFILLRSEETNNFLMTKEKVALLVHVEVQA